MTKKIRSCTYYVNGMHCAACEVLIEQKLTAIPQVKSAKASLQEGKVTLEFDTPIPARTQTLNQELRAHGYSLSTKPLNTAVWNKETISHAAGILSLLAIVGYILNDQGLLVSAQVSENSSIFGFLIFGIVAGISSCAALVGGLLVSLSRQWTQMYGSGSRYQKTLPYAMFNIGRLVSYIMLGGLLGIIGATIQLSIGATATMIAAVSLIMIIVGLQMLGFKPAKQIRFQIPRSMSRSMSAADNFQGKYMPFLAGAGTFFLPCGFTLIVQTLALTTGSFTQSAIMLGSFALGTLIPLTAISALSISFQAKPNFAGTFNLIAGILIVLFGVYNINSQLVVLGLPNLTTRAQVPVKMSLVDGLGSEIKSISGKEEQFMYMRAKGFAYEPSTITLKSGVPTTATIQTENAIGCAQAMYMQGLYDKVIYLNKPKQEVSFIPKKGTYYISCTMGMVSPVVVNVI